MLIGPKLTKLFNIYPEVRDYYLTIHIESCDIRYFEFQKSVSRRISKTRNCLHKVNTEFFSTHSIKPKILLIIITDLKNSTTWYIQIFQYSYYTISKERISIFCSSYEFFDITIYALSKFTLNTACGTKNSLYHKIRFKKLRIIVYSTLPIPIPFPRKTVFCLS